MLAPKNKTTLMRGGLKNKKNYILSKSNGFFYDID
jgi:hypothetical protein